MSDKKRILATRRLPPPVEARLARDYDAVLNPDDRLYDPDSLIAAALGAEVLERLPLSVRIAGTLSAGTNLAARARRLA
jgi:hypothetical protein